VQKVNCSSSSGIARVSLIWIGMPSSRALAPGRLHEWIGHAPVSTSALDPCGRSPRVPASLVQNASTSPLALHAFSQRICPGLWLRVGARGRRGVVPGRASGRLGPPVSLTSMYALAQGARRGSTGALRPKEGSATLLRRRRSAGIMGGSTSQEEGMVCTENGGGPGIRGRLHRVEAQW
jgi:hypothetical protein